MPIVHKGGGARSCSCSCREAQKGGAKGRRKARGAGPMVVFYSELLCEVRRGSIDECSSLLHEVVDLVSIRVHPALNKVEVHSEDGQLGPPFLTRLLSV